MDEKRLKVEIANAISTLSSLLEERERKEFNKFIESYVHLDGNRSNMYQRLARLLVCRNTVFYVYNGCISTLEIRIKDVYASDYRETLEDYSKQRKIVTYCVDECEHCSVYAVKVHPEVEERQWKHKIFKPTYPSRKISGVFMLNSHEVWLTLQHGTEHIQVPVTSIRIPEFRDYIVDAGYIINDVNGKTAYALSINDMNLGMWSCPHRELDGYHYKQGKSLSKWKMATAKTAEEFERAVVQNNADYLSGYNVDNSIINAAKYVATRLNSKTR